MSKTFQAWQQARFEPAEQLSPFALLQIPTGFYVINFGTLSNLKLP
jgi:hypothetical protein